MHPEFKDRFLERLAERLWKVMERPHESLSSIEQICSMITYAAQDAHEEVSQIKKTCTCEVCDWCKDGEMLDIMEEAFCKPKEELRWRPKIGDSYYTIDFTYSYTTAVMESTRTWIGCDYDKMRLRHGVVFPTREAAEEALKKIKDILLS